jgi:succinyl-diaminopimelate desuccinylase
VNDTIHKVNECVSIDDLDTLSNMYYGIIENLLNKK